MRQALLVISVCLLASVAVAKTRQWQDATVLKLTSNQEGTQAVVIPIGGGLYGASGSITRAYYWIKTDKITYVVHNYSNGLIVQRWLVLTIGGHTKVAVDGRDLHILDDEGKDRACRIVMKIANTD